METRPKEKKTLRSRAGSARTDAWEDKLYG
jgi:hypothetical protein